MNLAALATPTTGCAGPSQILNLTTVAYPGSVQAHVSRRTMAITLAPILHYNATQQDFYGGNFWDMRATGARLQSAAAEQSQGPPTNPVEMGLPDSACVAYRLSRGNYAYLFVKVWGPSLQSIQWPADAEKTCSTPVGKNGVGTQLNLSTEDRNRASAVYDQFALAIAAYEYLKSLKEVVHFLQHSRCEMPDDQRSKCEENLLASG